MISLQRFQAFLTRAPLIAVAAYFGLIVVFLAMTIGQIVEITRQRDELAAASEILERMEVRDPVRTSTVRPAATAPAGSPFLEGASASVASASLLQRLAVATKRVNGNTNSSQVDLQGPLSKAGFISATSSLEIEPNQLQALLYDLEAGMPFLFIDQLVVQAPSTSSPGGKLRVLLGVSGQRQPPK
ncbi:general secretion pathway protein GspM [Bradyrhizobium sp. INPA01-394B]|uniref:Type II secretion system protein M n=1 Tax=Bradyrhizobium campsiandrae TaxID=1729892 RepID=A0ABR7UB73_9BRAD|nr:type II secretion system protein GspM [Bradyrhizobium campsiandrae]MBC9879636.1 general secretion pathway protein GspM [Bradyrhizobium campsiandrae]MBC9980759.1 type II secretion system protein M [Bradyrhizobium campsiandrae]